MRNPSEFTPYSVSITPISFLKPSEEIDHEEVQRLALKISHAGVWNTAIPIERSTGIIMDGNHRFRAAQILGLKKLPCILLDYDDPRVSVTCWKTGALFPVSTISEEISKGRIFPFKTTRHAFLPSLPLVNVGLAAL